MDTRLAGNATTITANAKRLVERVHETFELVVVAVFQPNVWIRPEIVIAGHGSEIEQIAGVQFSTFRRAR